MSCPVRVGFSSWAHKKWLGRFNGDLWGRKGFKYTDSILLVSGPKILDQESANHGLWFISILLPVLVQPVKGESFLHF
jgi:hypothetical protein